MEVYALAGLLLIGTFLVGLTPKFSLATAGGILIPMPMVAVVQWGSANFNVGNVYFACLVALALAGWIATAGLSGGGVIRVPKYWKLPVAIGLYVGATAIILPRVFAGDLYVFSVAREEGIRISQSFGSSLVPLHPSVTNATQTAYVWLALAFLLLFLSLGRRHGPAYLERVLVAAASAHILASAIDFVGLDAALQPFRTAGYRDHANDIVFGFSRVVGLFPEASKAGAFAASMFAYFYLRYITSGLRWALVLAAASGVVAVLSFSSTAVISLIAVGLLAPMLTAFSNRKAAVSRFFASASIIALFGLMALLLTGYSGAVLEAFYGLVFDKIGTQSGLERGAWAAHGWSLFLDTYGLGVGAGSTTTNGLPLVWLANFGVGGTLLYVALVSKALPGRSGFEGRADRSIYWAALAGFGTQVTGMLASQTIPDLGILFMLLLACAISANERRGLVPSNAAVPQPT